MVINWKRIKRKLKWVNYDLTLSDEEIEEMEELVKKNIEEENKRFTYLNNLK